MPRKGRLLVPECPHHIVQRGHNRNAVFLADQDFQYYLDNLTEWKLELNIEIYAWCLMTNHVHIIARPPKQTQVLSEMMKRVNGRQTMYMNKLESRSGSLWNGRFKASPIQEEQYLLNCFRYIELNPVRAGMVRAPQDYPWSSYRERLSEIEGGILDASDYFTGLGNSHDERVMRYKAFLREGTSEKERKFLRDSVRRNQLTGNRGFTDEIERRIGSRIENRAQGRPRNVEK